MKKKLVAVEDLMTVADVAEYADRTPAAIYAMIARGAMIEPIYRSGKLMLFHRPEVEAMSWPRLGRPKGKGKEVPARKIADAIIRRHRKAS